MSDEISILSLISEDNPTSSSGFISTETNFSIDNRIPHSIPVQVRATFTCLHNAMRAVAPVPVMWRIPHHTGQQHPAISSTIAPPYFANAKTAFTPFWTATLFLVALAIHTLSDWDCRLIPVNGSNDFKIKFEKSNEVNRKILTPNTNRHDGERA
ncbi:hypothetical protein [Dickeya poaceiphila]|uniref:Uncharacterized protein n=1 Tax=Dickeya poaceiphila TaxID=568768 RepID=A0A5B8I4B0_9GAMM|nr:hypothetical protein [Dickeya poaceiphila]QDX29892.1 hypothetical protein Dpoa569_0001718 [Dickeya poaceiphila]